MPNLHRLLVIITIVSMCNTCFVNSSSNFVLADEQLSTKEPTKPLASIKTDADFNQWITYYYIFPQPDLTPQAIIYAQKVGMFDHHNTIAPMMAFFMQVFAHNPTRLHGWVQELTTLNPPLKESYKELVFESLMLAGTKESIPQGAIMGGYLSPPANTGYVPNKPIEQWPIDKAMMLDMLWGSFFATGDEKYIRRIISTLEWLQPGQKDPNKQVIAAAAQWSLSSNAVQHKRVMQICLKERDAQPGLKSILDEIVTQGDTGPSVEEIYYKAREQTKP